MNRETHGSASWTTPPEGAWRASRGTGGGRRAKVAVETPWSAAEGIPGAKSTLSRIRNGEGGGTEGSTVWVTHLAKYNVLGVASICA